MTSSKEIKAELQVLEASIEQVLKGECGSLALHRHTDGEIRLDEQLYRTAADLGWLGIGLPQAAGGLGLSHTGLAFLHQRLGEALAPGPFAESLSILQWLAARGPHGQIDALVARLLSGQQWIACPAFFGHPPLILDAKGRVSGRHPFMLGPDSSSWALVPVTNGAGADLWAIVGLGDGAKLSRLPTWDRFRSVCQLAIVDVAPILVLNADGESEGEGDGPDLECLLSLAIACDSLGAARRILSLTVEYLKTREQFGRPIGAFQALQHRVADIAADIALVGEIVDHAVHCSEIRSADAGFWAALAKVQATDIHMHAATEAIQMHGAIGFTWEHDAHLYLKRAALNQRLVRSAPAHLDRAHSGLTALGRNGQSLSELAL